MPIFAILIIHCVVHAVVYLATCSLITASVVIFVLTWARSYKQCQEMRQLQLSSSISVVLLRNGMYSTFAHLCMLRIMEYFRHCMFYVS